MARKKKEVYHVETLTEGKGSIISALMDKNEIKTAEDIQKIISLSIGENESAKYWLSVLNELKNRGVKDMMILCADGLRGIQEAVTTAFP
ncbi:MAG: transposase, partial [Dialister sp.]|nr:transposase [Dialister sp.]